MTKNEPPQLIPEVKTKNPGVLHKFKGALWSKFGHKNKQNDDKQSVGAFGCIIEDFLDADVSDIMLHRNETRALKIGTSTQEILGIVREFCYNARIFIPVYEESIDQMKGYVNVCDLVEFLLSGDTNFNWQKYVHKLLFISPSMQVGALLMRMRKTKARVAIVLDEYGGTDGVVHFDNIVSLLAENSEHVNVTSNVFEVSGRIDLEVLSSKLNLDLSVEDMPDDIETLGGLILFMLGRVPVAGETVNHVAGLKFTIKDANAKSILRVVIERTSEKQITRSSRHPEIPYQQS